MEFWHHGWDHKRWTDYAGKELREFCDGGFERQHKHDHDAKAAMTRVLGHPPRAFGGPYNATDDDSFKILNDDDDMRLVFAYGSRGRWKKLPS